MFFKSLPTISRWLFLLSLVAFVSFLFAPFFWYDSGWMFWEVLANPHEWRYWSSAGIASLIATGLLVVVSPFLGRVWVGYKPTWILCLCVSGLAIGGLWPWIAFALNNYPGTYPPKPLISNPGHYIRGICLIVTTALLNFTGILFAQREKSVEKRSRGPEYDDIPGTPPE